MTDDKSTDDLPTLHNISRRRVLGGLGAIGIASAGAGLGTSAFFSDTETFENNVLTAGALDLVVDWEEHYSDWSDDEGVDNEGRVLDIQMSEPADPSMYVGLPDPMYPMIWVHEDDLGTFMDNTTLESYPDADNNRVQDDLSQYAACEDFAQLDENLDPTNGRGDGVRSANRDTILNYDAYQEGADPEVAPLVNLDDVKPGDFGELTLSVHLCDNPGYLWMQGALGLADENGVTEPEGKDPDEVDGVVELLDEIQTLLWYDEDGDNVYEPGASGSGEGDIVLIIDNSGSMGTDKMNQAKDGAKLLVDTVGPSVRVGVVSFTTQEALVHELSSDKASVKGAIDGITSQNLTNIEGGINGARDIFEGTDVSAEVDPTVLADGSTPNYAVLLSDGAPNVDDDGDSDVDPVDEAQFLKDAGVEVFTIAYGVSDGSTTDLLMEDIASDPTDSHAYLATDINEIEAIFGQIGQIVAGEECFFQGSLRTLLDLVTPDPANGEFGIPLDGIRATAFQEVTGDDASGDGRVDSNYGLGDGTAEARDSFVDSTNNFIGLAWWLPLDHANEIQTDSVTFDLGFYTEQARHNSGAGQSA